MLPCSRKSLCKAEERGPPFYRDVIVLSHNASALGPHPSWWVIQCRSHLPPQTKGEDHTQPCRHAHPPTYLIPQDTLFSSVEGWATKIISSLSGPAASPRESLMSENFAFLGLPSPKPIMIASNLIRKRREGQVEGAGRYTFHFQ